MLVEFEMSAYISREDCSSGFHPQVHVEISLAIGGYPLSYVLLHKFLSVTVDRKLTSTSGIKGIRQRITAATLNLRCLAGPHWGFRAGQ